MRFIFLFLLCTSCAARSGHYQCAQELPPTKQKQKIALLRKKIQIAEKEEKKIKAQIDRLSDEMRETELKYIRKQIDDYEEIIRKQPIRKFEFSSSDLFLEEREKLYRMIQKGESLFEAQIVLDRIMQLANELAEQGCF